MLPPPALQAPESRRAASVPLAPSSGAQAPLPVAGRLWHDLLRLGLLPCVLLTLLLASGFTYQQLRALDAAFEQGGQDAARQLATLAEPDLRIGDASALRRLAAGALRGSLAARVEIDGDAGDIHVAAGEPAPATHRRFSATVEPRGAEPETPPAPAFAPTPAPPTALASDVPLGVVRVYLDGRPLARERARTLIGAAVLALLALGAAALAMAPLLRRLLHPLHRIAGTAAALEAGRLEARCGIVAAGRERPPHELVRLARHVDGLAGQLQAAHARAAQALSATAGVASVGGEPAEAEAEAPGTAITWPTAPVAPPEPAAPWPRDPFVEARLADARAGRPPVVRPRQQGRHEGAAFLGVLPDPLIHPPTDPWAGALIDLWRLDRHAPAPAAADVPLAELFERLAAQFAPLAAQTHTRLLWRDRGLGVHADPAPLQRLLSHLVSHAMRQVPPEGTVLVVARAWADGVHLAVRDNGVGIAPAHHQRIFEAFYQASAPDGGRAGGFGLGLAIAARAAQRLGTHIGLRSAPGRGSCFWLRLPRSTAPPPAAVGSLAGLRCLAVGDAAVMAPACALLAQWDCTVDRATNAVQAMTALSVRVARTPAAAAQATQAAQAAPRIDVLLCEAQLGGGGAGGFGGDAALAVIEALRRIEPHALAIVLAAPGAPGSADALRRLRHTGALRLALPVSPARLRALLSLQLSRTRAG